MPNPIQRHYHCPATVRISRGRDVTWYELALQCVDKRTAAQLMNCTPKTADKSLNSARREIHAGVVEAIGRTGNTALEALALFLQSNFPAGAEPRKRCRMESVFAR